MAHLIPTIKQQFRDANGDPLAGGKLYSYQAGTSTLLATYVDQTEATPNTNPIILDANGEADIWLGANSYKFVLKTSADVTVRTVDNVAHLNLGSVTTAKIADGAVTTSKIADGAITAAKLGTGAAAANIGSGAISTAMLADLLVTTGKIADGAITPAKLAALGQQISNSCSSATSTTSATYQDVTNLSVSITTTGRPVFVGLIPDGGSLFCQFSGYFGTSAKIVRASTGIGFFAAPFRASGTTETHSVPATVIQTIDTPAAGTHTYKIQYNGDGSSGTCNIWYAKLVAYEL